MLLPVIFLIVKVIWQLTERAKNIAFKAIALTHQKPPSMIMARDVGSSAFLHINAIIAGLFFLKYLLSAGNQHVFNAPQFLESNFPLFENNFKLT